MGNKAFAYAALEAGVRVVAGYPGTPSSEVIETISDAVAEGKAKNVYVEWSTNEKVAVEVLAGASAAGARTLFTCKQMGMNVASDPLMVLNYVGVKGGYVLFVADDPGPISSQTEQDTRRYASFAKVPVFDPATPEQGCEMMKAAYELSEKYSTPVIFRPTTRLCHASTFSDIPEQTCGNEPSGFEKNDSKWVIFPPRANRGHGEINERLPKIAADTAQSAFNPWEQVGQEPVVGIVAGGISYAYAKEALRQLEEKAAQKSIALPAYKIMQIGTPYPFPENAVLSFAEGLEQVIVFEELDSVIEEEMMKFAGKHHCQYDVHGKLDNTTTTRGENSVDCIEEQLAEFFGIKEELVAQLEKTEIALDTYYPNRPPSLCAGCPHRGSFYAVKEALRRDQIGIFCGDIGCYTLGNADPLRAVDTCLCMGAGVTMAQGFNIVEPEKKSLAFIGDSTFFASGMTGVANAVYNQHDITIVVLDNSTTAMTGDQPHPGTGKTLTRGKTKPLSIPSILESMGVLKITQANPLFAEESIEAAREAINYPGPSAVIFKWPCANLTPKKQPAHFPTNACAGCRMCTSRIGCPALNWNEAARRISINRELCTGCGLCTDVCQYDVLRVPSRKKKVKEVPLRSTRIPASDGSLMRFYGDPDSE